jgi:transposase
MSAPIELPEDLESLRALVLRQHAELTEKSSLLGAHQQQLAEQAEQIRCLEEYVRLLKHQRFGRSSERHPEAQLGLFNEAEVAADDAEKEEGVADEIPIPAHPRRRCGGRRPIPAFLPRVEILHDLDASQKICPADGTALERIGEETSEQLELIPATLRVLRHVRPKYACPQCRCGIHVVPMPAQPIPKSLASPALLAHVAVSKYADGLPLYRQEGMLQRIGIDLPRATLSRWMVKMGELGQPLVNLLRDDLLAGSFLQCDETPFQVLKEPGKAASSLSYLWVQRGGTRDAPILLYDYDPSRSGEVPKQLLDGFQGVLQTDGYAGYAAVGSQPGIVHVGCWSHVRRKFHEAAKAMHATERKARSAKESKALQGLGFIRRLYEIERLARGESAQERQRLRHERSRPVMEAMRDWLDEALPRIAPQSLTGKALAYLHRQWPKLVRVLDDGRIPLDTNLVENAIRPFVVGRKGWLFADTVRGAQASANLYSLIETAKANGLEPYAYLRLVFTELPRATTLEHIEALLPWNADRGKMQAGSAPQG